MAQEFYELPGEWEWKGLGEICHFLNGYAFKSSDYTHEGHFLIRIGNVQDGLVVLDNPKYTAIPLGQDRFDLMEGDLLMSLTGNVGRVGFIEKEHLPAALNQRVAKVHKHDDKQVMIELLFSFFRTPLFLKEIYRHSHGAAQKNVSTKDIASIKIPLPPLNEQKRIVAKLDALFTRIDTAITHLQQTLELSKALFASAYNETFDKIDTPEVELGSVADFFNGFAFKGKELIEEGVPVLRISNIQKGGISFLRMANFPEQNVTEDVQRFYVEPNDIVIAMSGATTGKVAINDSGMRLLQNQRVGRFVIQNEYTRKFVYQFLSIKVEQNLQQAMGAAQPNLSTKQIKEIKIPLPSLDEQQEIVQHLDALTDRMHTLGITTQEKLTDLNTLKASLLDAAFKGEL